MITYKPRCLQPSSAGGERAGRQGGSRPAAALLLGQKRLTNWTPGSASSASSAGAARAASERGASAARGRPGAGAAAARLRSMSSQSPVSTGRVMCTCSSSAYATLMMLVYPKRVKFSSRL